jgi:hypothetical protein
VAQWWELAIPAAAGLLGGLGGAGISGWMNHWTTAETLNRQMDERRHQQFLDQRRAAYVRFLGALKEWEPLRDRDWRLRAAADDSSLTRAQREEAMAGWQRSRELTEPYFRRLIEAEQEVSLLAPRRVRDIATYLSVESSRGGKTAQLMEEFLQAVRLDIGTDSDRRDAGSALLEEPGAFQEGIPKATSERDA